MSRNLKRNTQFLAALMFCLCSLPAHCFFRFGHDSYTVEPVEWPASGDLELRIPVQLQSCYGLSLNGFWGCSVLQKSEDYGIQVTDVSLESASTSIGIEKVVYRQQDHRESLVLLNGGKLIDTSNDRLIPGTWQQVSGHFELNILEDVLWGAKPGVYRGTVSINGEETNGVSSRDRAVLNFEVGIPLRTRVSMLNDVALVKHSNDGSVSSLWQSFCVFTQGDVDFRLSATGRDSSFSLRQATEEIPYQLLIRSMAEESREISIVPGQHYVWQGSSDRNCSGTGNMQLKVTVPASALSSKPAAIYSDVVTIEVQAA